MALLLVSTGCDDPSNLGQGLVDAQAGETVVVPFSPSSFEQNTIGDQTGGNAAAGALRALFGAAEDPIAGTISSHGFVDFVPSSQFDSSFLTGSVSFAELVFDIDYVYGDTTGTTTFDVVSVPDDWLSTQIRADSTIVTGSLVTSVTAPAVRGQIRIPLPESWITTNDPLLRSDGFSANFHGFGLIPTQSDAVLGIRFLNSELRASAVPGDTVSFVLSKVGSIAGTPAQPNNDYVFLRDGAEGGLNIRFPFEDGPIDDSMIHRVLLRFQTESVSSAYPTGFAVNRPGTIGLRAVSADGTVALEVAEINLNEDGSFTFDNTTLTNLFQSANLGKSILDRFEMYLPAEQSGVGFLTFRGSSGTEDPGIQAFLTLTPIN